MSLRKLLSGKLKSLFYNKLVFLFETNILRLLLAFETFLKNTVVKLETIKFFSNDFSEKVGILGIPWNQ